MKHILFICSQNKLRSPTAEKVFAGMDGFKVRSAGLDKDATQVLTEDLVLWADTIFVMEKSHRNKLLKKFKNYISTQRIICLNIPDEYDFMDFELVVILKEKLNGFFGVK